MMPPAPTDASVPGIVLGLPEVLAVGALLLSGYGVLARVIYSLWREYREVTEQRRQDAAAAIPALVRAADQIAHSGAVLAEATRALRELGLAPKEGA